MQPIVIQEMVRLREQKNDEEDRANNAELGGEQECVGEETGEVKLKNDCQAKSKVNTKHRARELVGKFARVLRGQSY